MVSQLWLLAVLLAALLPSVEGKTRFSRVDIPDPTDADGHGLHRQVGVPEPPKTLLQRHKGHLGRDEVSWKRFHEDREKREKKKTDEVLKQKQPSSYIRRTNEKGEVLPEPKVGLDHAPKPWPKISDLSPEVRQAMRQDIANGMTHEDALAKYGLQHPGEHFDPGRCYNAASKQCKGLSYNHGEFIKCAVERRAQVFFGENEDCLHQFAELWEPCATDVASQCGRMGADKTMECLLAPETASTLSPECLESDIYGLLSMRPHENGSQQISSNSKSQSKSLSGSPKAGEDEDL
jgi:hypothetical protein